MTPYYMRGRKRNPVIRGGHTSAEDADRGAMAGGGADSRGGRGGRIIIPPVAKVEENDTAPSKKRKRGQNSSEIEGEKMSLDEPNGKEDEDLSEEKFPKLGN